jgi:mono/diheme cytochrome c family protein
MSTRIRICALIAAQAGVISAGCRGGKSEQPPFHLNPNMDYQARLDPQEPFAPPDDKEAFRLFADNRAMRPRVKATVPMRLDLGADDAHLYEGKVDGQPATGFPKRQSNGEAWQLTRADLERGRERFQIYCVPCHDATGNGEGVIVERSKAPGSLPLKVPSFHEERLLQAPIGRLYDVITHGWGQMSAYRTQLTVVEDRWRVAAYVRALQRSRRLETKDLPVDRAASERWLNP